MAREHAQVKLSMWDDDDVRDLSPAAQHLYFVLMTSPSLSYCGVADWRPKRLAALAKGWTAAHVVAAAIELRDALFIVVDEETEEVLIRSWVRNDGLMAREKMGTAMATAHAAISSQVLRGVVVYELQRLHDEQPGLLGFRSAKASALLAKEGIAASDVSESMPLGMPLGMAQPGENMAFDFDPQLLAPSSLLLTPAPSSGPSAPELPHADSVAASEIDEAPSRKKPAINLPESWVPTDKHWQMAAELNVDLSAEVKSFRNHAEANDRRQVNWNAAFNQWLTHAAEYAKKRASPGGPKLRELAHDPKTGRALDWA